MNDEMIKWLVQEAELETLNVKLKSLARLEFLFTSKEKLEENKKEASKSLGKLELIAKILEENKKQLQRIVQV